MVLQIDVSAPLLRPSQLGALARAVHGADRHDEHRWIEWKSTLDLIAPTGLAHLAKHIIGLANRQPAAAAQRAGGYGYLLVGVAPATIDGVVTVDPETLVGKLRVYVGDAVRWTPEFIGVDGKTVLIVIVDPPRPGDPIHSLRKGIDGFEPGTIFVRHTGRTEPATAADLDMLQARLLERSPILQMTVAAVPPTIEETPDIIDAANQWVERRRPALLTTRHQPAPRSALAEALQFPVRDGFTIFGPQVRPDERTEQQYVQQVEEFLDMARDALVERASWDLFRHAPALLHLEVRNPTDLGYTAVRLAVHLPGRVNSYPEELADIVEGARQRLPQQPEPLGTPTVMNNLLAQMGGYPGIMVPPIPNLTRYIGPGPEFTVRDTGSVTIEYREFELRPSDVLALPPVPLLVHENEGAALTATWSATAAQVRGRLTGELTITVVASTLDLTNLDHDDDVGR